MFKHLPTRISGLLHRNSEHPFQEARQALKQRGWRTPEQETWLAVIEQSMGLCPDDPQASRLIAGWGLTPGEFAREVKAAIEHMNAGMPKGALWLDFYARQMERTRRDLSETGVDRHSLKHTLETVSDSLVEAPRAAATVKAWALDALPVDLAEPETLLSDQSINGLGIQALQIQLDLISSSQECRRPILRQVLTDLRYLTANLVPAFELLEFFSQVERLCGSDASLEIVRELTASQPPDTGEAA